MVCVRSVDLYVSLADLYNGKEVKVGLREVALQVACADLRLRRACLTYHCLRSLVISQ